MALTAILLVQTGHRFPSPSSSSTTPLPDPPSAPSSLAGSRPRFFYSLLFSVEVEARIARPVVSKSLNEWGEALE